MKVMNFLKCEKNTLKVAKESDIILYLVDGKLAPDDEDRQFLFFKKLGKPIALVVNKVDNKKMKKGLGSLQFWSKGNLQSFSNP